MTDDSVIEARKALERYDDRNSKPNPAHLADAIRGLLARIDEAGAVFEKAHAKKLDTSTEPVRNGADSLHIAPTDDEREALINDGTDDAWQAIADAIGTLGYSLNSHEDTAKWVQQYLFAPAEAPEPQIECPHWSPGRTTLRKGCTACAAEASRSREDRTAEFANMAAIMGLPEPQGEPSDAQVLAARNAYQEAHEADYDFEDCVAFALRAAGGVR